MSNLSTFRSARTTKTALFRVGLAVGLASVATFAGIAASESTAHVAGATVEVQAAQPWTDTGLGSW